jgi:hypothetical protein
MTTVLHRNAPVAHSDRVLRPELAAAAGFLGLRDAELRSRLRGGATLGQLARERHRPLRRLVQTMLDVGRAQRQAAVPAGLLTQAQLEEIAADLRGRIEDSTDCWIPFPRVRAGAPMSSGGVAS